MSDVRINMSRMGIILGVVVTIITIASPLVLAYANIRENKMTTDQLKEEIRQEKQDRIQGDKECRELRDNDRNELMAKIDKIYDYIINNSK